MNRHKISTNSLCCNPKCQDYDTCLLFERDNREYCTHYLEPGTKKSSNGTVYKIKKINIIYRQNKK